MGDVISDTGPLLHLHEILLLKTLQGFRHLIIPDLVARELSKHSVDLEPLHDTGVSVVIEDVSTHEWEPVARARIPVIHPADAQVYVLSRHRHPQEPVLADDLALRRHLEAAGAQVVGSVGMLFRAFKLGVFDRISLEEAIDALFYDSSLHMSPAFRV